MPNWNFSNLRIDYKQSVNTRSATSKHIFALNLRYKISIIKNFSWQHVQSDLKIGERTGLAIFFCN